MCVQRVSAQCVLQFTPSLAAGCVLHRPENRVIHRLESCFWIFQSVRQNTSCCLFFFRARHIPCHLESAKKKPLLKRLFVNQNKRAILEKRRKRGRCAFCNPRIVPVHLKSPLNRGSRGLPLGASSKGTEATQRKRHIRTTVVFFVPSRRHPSLVGIGAR